jgi:phosphatidylethanolamine/phosphatidyl-N-methylethanolamine N-methyltransferase
MSLAETVHFFRSYLRDPAVVGAVAPSSRHLATALVRPFAQRSGPARVLEVGAGTGRITALLAELLQADDHLDICEINPTFAARIETEVLVGAGVQRARREGRLRVLCCPAQTIRDPEGYDFIVSGLPFTAFATTLVREILLAVRHNLRPGGVFSYFEYVGLRRLNRMVSTGRSRQRIHRVSALLDRHIERHQFSRDTIWLNFPPAFARHWRFEEQAAAGSVSA